MGAPYIYDISHLRVNELKGASSRAKLEKINPVHLRSCKKKISMLNSYLPAGPKVAFTSPTTFLYAFCISPMLATRTIILTVL